MKRILSIVLCAATASAFADNNPSNSEAVFGTVGVTAITTSLSNAIVAVSYDDLAGGEGIVVSNLVKTTNLTVGDQLAVFTNGVYSTWRLEQVGGDTGPKYWAKNEKEFTVDSDGKLTQGEGTAASTVTQTVGTGIWLVRQKPIADGGSTNTFYIYGKPTTSKVSTIADHKWTLIGNPRQTRVKIGTVEAADTVVVKGAADFDQIVVPVPPNGELGYYTFKTGKGWRTTKLDEKGNSVWDATPPTLDPGLGCWIYTASDATIEW